MVKVTYLMYTKKWKPLTEALYHIELYHVVVVFFSFLSEQT